MSPPLPSETSRCYMPICLVAPEILVCTGARIRTSVRWLKTTCPTTRRHPYSRCGRNRTDPASFGSSLAYPWNIRTHYFMFTLNLIIVYLNLSNLPHHDTFFLIMYQTTTFAFLFHHGAIYPQNIYSSASFLSDHDGILSKSHFMQIIENLCLTRPRIIIFVN